MIAWARWAELVSFNFPSTDKLAFIMIQSSRNAQRRCRSSCRRARSHRRTPESVDSLYLSLALAEVGAACTSINHNITSKSMNFNNHVHAELQDTLKHWQLAGRHYAHQSWPHNRYSSTTAGDEELKLSVHVCIDPDIDRLRSFNAI